MKNYVFPGLLVLLLGSQQNTITQAHLALFISLSSEPTASPTVDPSATPSATTIPSPTATATPTFTPTPTPASQYMSIGSHPGWARDVYPTVPCSSGQTTGCFDYTPWTHIFDFGVYLTSSGDICICDMQSQAYIDQAVPAAHAAGKKIIAVIGGEHTGNAFVGATNSTNRAKFIQNIVNHIKNNNYDGVNIDWEENVDSTQFTALIRELKVALNNLQADPAYGRKPYYGVDVVSGLVAPSLMAQVDEEVDTVNLMAYQSDGQNEFNAYKNAGIPASKMIMGLGFSPNYYDTTVTRVQTKLNFVKQNGMAGTEVWAIKADDLNKGWADPRLQLLRDFVAGN